jgi:hypothetical protein
MQTLETWSMKAKRLALELKAARPENESATPKQRVAYRQARYAMLVHLESVTEDS